MTFIQEAHITGDIAKLWESEWGGKLFYSAGESNARGVVTLFKKGNREEDRQCW